MYKNYLVSTWNDLKSKKVPNKLQNYLKKTKSTKKVLKK